MKIELNQADVAAIKTVLSGVENAAARVLSRSINKTITSTRGYAAKEIASHYNLTQTRIRKDFRWTNATVSLVAGRLDAKGKPVSLTTFSGTRQTAKGVSVQILKDRPRWVWRHAFIRTANRARQAFYRPLPVGVARSSQLYKVWKRSSKYGVLPGKYRYGPAGTIFRLTGPRIEDEYAKPRTYNVVTKKSNDRLGVLLDQELNYELSKL